MTKDSCRIQDRIADEKNRWIVSVGMVSQQSDLELINPVQLSREV